MEQKTLPPPQEKSVFEEVKKQRAPKGKASVQDIIKADVERSGDNFEKVYTMLNQAIEAGKTRIMRHNNTLMIYHIIAPGEAEVHISTMDDPKQLVEAVKQFYEALKKIGFKKAISRTDNPQIGKMLSTAQVPVKVQQVPSQSGKPLFELTFGA